jgi:drug/metabolite transporter (DMT)-like permease
VMGHLFVAHALGHLSATMSSIVLLAQAPITALLAWPLLGEPIRVSQLVGGGLVLAGILVVNTRLATGGLRRATDVVPPAAGRTPPSVSK